MAYNVNNKKDEEDGKIMVTFTRFNCAWGINGFDLIKRPTTRI